MYHSLQSIRYRFYSHRLSVFCVYLFLACVICSCSKGLGANCVNQINGLGTGKQCEGLVGINDMNGPLYHQTKEENQRCRCTQTLDYLEMKLTSALIRHNHPITYNLKKNTRIHNQHHKFPSIDKSIHECNNCIGQRLHIARLYELCRYALELVNGHPHLHYQAQPEKKAESDANMQWAKNESMLETFLGIVDWIDAKKSKSELDLGLIRLIKEMVKFTDEQGKTACDYAKQDNNIDFETKYNKVLENCCTIVPDATNKGPFQCDICCASFCHAKGKADHQNVHKDAYQEVFSCKTSEKELNKRVQFSNQKELSRHRRLYHGKERECQCTICFRGFSSKKELKRHYKRIHKCKMLFACGLCGCGFKSCQTLHDHKKTQAHKDKSHQRQPNIKKQYWQPWR